MGIVVIMLARPKLWVRYVEYAPGMRSSNQIPSCEG